MVNKSFKEMIHLTEEKVCHIRPCDLFVTTQKVRDNRAVVQVKATVSNNSDVEVKGTITVRIGHLAVAQLLSVASRGSSLIEFNLELKRPELWSADRPNLYDLEMKINSNLGIEILTQKIGIRQIEIDDKQRIAINERYARPINSCVYHDNILADSGVFPLVEERKIKRLKEAGYDAIRCIYQSPSKELLDVCDRLGMYVINESFSHWHFGVDGKNVRGHDDRWKREIEKVVLRDRNHPSLLYWSVGNEAKESNDVNGKARLKKLTNYIKRLDSSRQILTDIYHQRNENESVARIYRLEKQYARMIITKGNQMKTMKV